jgi:hypothetical protein
MARTRQLFSSLALVTIVVGSSACSRKAERPTPILTGATDLSASATSAADAAAGAIAIDDSNDMHVSPGGADTPACGSSDAPCKTIQHGIDRARSVHVRVRVAAGEYEEALHLLAGTDVEGAGASDVIVRSPARANAVVVATDLGGAATLAGLTLRAHDARGGASSYGVMVRGVTSTLHLRDVVVEAGRGGDGAHGEDGLHADRERAQWTDTWRDGKDGDPGAAGGAGRFGPTGYVALSAGDGSRGDDGERGTSGGGGSCESCEVSYQSCSGPSLTSRQHGCTTAHEKRGRACGEDGTAGDGGRGGSEGLGGAGGGSSVALYAWDAVVSIDGGSLTSADGGAGGTGGGGGAGDEGRRGEPGPSRSCSTGSGNGAGGSAGGRGGQGGRGGRGGGGAGGPSLAIYEGGASHVIVNATRLAHGAGGKGAQGAPAGSAADRAP